MENLKKAMTVAQAHFGTEEVVEKSIYGMFQYQLFGAGGQRKGILVATNERLCFYTKYLGSETFEVFEYKNIDSIKVEKGLLGGEKVVFYHDGNREMMNLIEEGDLTAFVEFVKGKIIE
ncbi:PH domain-containing protein [Bacillus cereus]|nr:PH domain-containing protein [Bacillus cereus]